MISEAIADYRNIMVKAFLLSPDFHGMYISRSGKEWKVCATQKHRGAAATGDTIASAAYHAVIKAID